MLLATPDLSILNMRYLGKHAIMLCYPKISFYTYLGNHCLPVSLWIMMLLQLLIEYWQDYQASLVSV